MARRRRSKRKYARKTGFSSAQRNAQALFKRRRSEVGTLMKQGVSRKEAWRRVVGR